jgi:transposase
VPTEQIAALRDLTRYRPKLTAARTSETQRLSKTLEDAGIKLDSVASNPLGVSGRTMVNALIDGERRGEALAQLAKGSLRRKIPDLSVALTGRFGPHHVLMCRLHLRHIDELAAMIAEVETRIEELMRPFRRSDIPAGEHPGHR